MSEQEIRMMVQYAARCPYCDGKARIHSVRGSRERHIGLLHRAGCAWLPIREEMENGRTEFGIKGSQIGDVGADIERESTQSEIHSDIAWPFQYPTSDGNGERSLSPLIRKTQET